MSKGGKGGKLNNSPRPTKEIGREREKASLLPFLSTRETEKPSMHASRRETKRYAGRSQHLARHLQLPRALGQPSLLPPNPLSTPTELSQPVLQFPRGGDPWKCGMDTYFPREITTGDLLVDSRKSTRDASNCFIHRANFSNIARKLRSSKERKGQEFSSHELLSKFVQHQDQKARGFVAVIKQEIAVAREAEKRGRITRFAAFDRSRKKSTSNRGFPGG